MLITTSRKPGSRTRSFCQTLHRVLNSEYVNRGKMSMRDVLLKASQLNHDTIAVVFEKHGNPSKITFYDCDGSEIIYITLNAALPEKRIKIHKDHLSYKCDVKDLCFLGDILNIESDNESELDFLWIKKSDNDYKAILEFFDSSGISTGFKIFIKNFNRGEGAA
ncbi:Brix domain-containing protein [Methanobacterium alcaliphilum]|uniref:Brix domain-containing protein n=1 Tax=Methanobacterium alcaliphilum TaxID=392018 RepID=UPI00200B2D4E|nr:ribosomal biogenesis protein [Methanobacterium alcaliphilum]MCK9152058.1 ribosomal biogenesis protein [Methanobacterium alcaliphilum]